jgi:signal transduction histidine kinase
VLKGAEAVWPQSTSNEPISPVGPTPLPEQVERLLRITAAIADAVTSHQVFDALVDQVGEALGASSAALWLVRDGATAHLARACGYDDAAIRRYGKVALADGAHVPIADAMRRGTPIWLGSQDEMVEAYPRMSVDTVPGRHFRIGCLPIIAQRQVIGALAFTFELDDGWGNADERAVLALVVRHAGQALERLRLLEAEQTSRARAEEEAARASVLYALARSVLGAAGVDQVYEAALDAVSDALTTDHASLVMFDAEGALRVAAARGRAGAQPPALDCWSPWPRETRDPVPVLVPDIAADAGLVRDAPPLPDGAGGALAFVPLVAAGRLMGQLVVHHAAPHQLSPRELDLARAAADHVAAAVARFKAVSELREAVRFNELFTGILGHDLRNPLSAIITSARIATARDHDEQMTRPLQRILRSGERMARMIDQLLDFTRVRVGSGMPLNRQPLNLPPLVRQIMDELDEANPAWSLRLDERGDCRGRWDADRLSQVFSNLVGNALQHGQPEGGLSVVLDGSAAEHVRVEVHNRGTIPPDLLPRLFEPLAGRARRLPGSRGLGLGLYIASEIVKAHGGEISARCDGGGETTFTLVLPREIASEAAP